MHRTLITLVVALMICGTAIAAESFSSGYSGSTTSVDSEGQLTATSGNQSTAMVDDEKVTDEKATEAEAKPEEAVKVKRRRFVHRLPNYFSTVVTDEQKAAIYEIQDEYAPKIHEYRDKLAAALKERNAKINALLTPEQQEKIEQMKEATKARRKAAKKAKAEKATSSEAK